MADSNHFKNPVTSAHSLESQPTPRFMQPSVYEAHDHVSTVFILPQ